MTYEETGQVIDHMINGNESERIALHTAKEALDKQIPKRPEILESSESKGKRCLHCPRCGTEIGWYENEPTVTVVHLIQHYCTECGQHIMWGI